MLLPNTPANTTTGREVTITAMVTFMEHLLCDKLCALGFRHMILFDPLKTPGGRQGGWGEEGEDLGFMGSEAYSTKKKDEITIFAKILYPGKTSLGS